MSAYSGHNLGAARTFAAARQIKLQRTLESYGVLTRASLREAADADRWAVDFDLVLQRAVEAGRVRALGGELYEARPPQAPRA